MACFQGLCRIVAVLFFLLLSCSGDDPIADSGPEGSATEVLDAEEPADFSPDDSFWDVVEDRLGWDDSSVADLSESGDIAGVTDLEVPDLIGEGGEGGDGGGLGDAAILDLDAIDDEWLSATPDDGGVPDVAAPPDDPWEWGPYQVGTTSYQFYDWDRWRSVPTTVWYPAKPLGQDKATYLVVVNGKAYTKPSPNLDDAPYPIVLFSHGFRGTAVQSITFTEHLASHGYVVVAMDHSGNTLTNFFSDDEKVAEVALERPQDVIFAFEKVLEEAGKSGGLLSDMVDPSMVAVTGHSFGGYTALMVGGAKVDVSNAQATCQAGTPADIFCDYVGYWPSGEIVQVEPGIANLKAVIALTPGGTAAFGPTGLAGEKVPTAVFGGSLDDTCPVDVETDPIYLGLPAPKIECVIESASHMSYTNVCDIPLSDQFIQDYCGVEGMLGPDDTFAVANGIAVAFLKLWLEDKSEYAQFLEPDYLATRCPTMEYKKK